MYDVVVKKFTFTISSPDEFLVHIANAHDNLGGSRAHAIQPIGMQGGPVVVMFYKLNIVIFVISPM